MSVGPWQPIYVRAYNTRIQSFYPRTSVSLDNLQPSLNLDLELSGQYPSKVHILLKDKAGKMIKEETKDLAKPENALTDVVQWKFEHSEVELWWPAGYGEQHLYTVEVTLLNSVSVLFPVVFD
jgi:beta-mannosidase